MKYSIKKCLIIIVISSLLLIILCSKSWFKNNNISDDIYAQTYISDNIIVNEDLSYMLYCLNNELYKKYVYLPREIFEDTSSHGEGNDAAPEEDVRQYMYLPKELFKDSR